MTTLEEARTVLNKLSVADRQSVIEWLTHDSEEVASGIFRTPGVCGGEACVRNLRLTVWLLEEGRRAGATDAQLIQSHPALTREDLSRAWDYVRAHREEIDRAIRENSEV
jgi:uncharacterized protein (DUF433 family)